MSMRKLFFKAVVLTVCIAFIATNVLPIVASPLLSL